MVRPVATREGSMTGAPPETSTVVLTAPTRSAGVDHRLSAGVQYYALPPLLFEAFFLDCDGVCPDRQIGDDEVSLFVAIASRAR